jgi:hypothetical protein
VPTSSRSPHGAANNNEGQQGGPPWRTLEVDGARGRPTAAVPTAAVPTRPHASHMALSALGYNLPLSLPLPHPSHGANTHLAGHCPKSIGVVTLQIHIRSAQTRVSNTTGASHTKESRSRSVGRGGGSAWIGPSAAGGGRMGMACSIPQTKHSKAEVKRLQPASPQALKPLPTLALPQPATQAHYLEIINKQSGQQDGKPTWGLLERPQRGEGPWARETKVSGEAVQPVTHTPRTCTRGQRAPVQHVNPNSKMCYTGSRSARVASEYGALSCRAT